MNRRTKHSTKLPFDGVTDKYANSVLLELALNLELF